VHPGRRLTSKQLGTWAFYVFPFVIAVFRAFVRDCTLWRNRNGQRGLKYIQYIYKTPGEWRSQTAKSASTALNAAQWFIIICGCRHKMKCEIYALFCRIKCKNYKLLCAARARTNCELRFWKYGEWVVRGNGN